MKAVFLDAATLGHDVDLAPIREAVDELVQYEQTSPDQVDERIAGFDTVITNKVVLGEANFDAHPEVRHVVVTATGTNNIDLEAARTRGIKVVNAIRYGRASVAQHTMTLILALATRLIDYHQDVGAGCWEQSSQFCLMDHPIMELEGKTLGIVGYGDLGQGVAELAKAFGMNILLATRPGQTPGEVDGYPRIPLDDLLPRVDVLSLHCLLTEETRNLIDADALSNMQTHALLINTSRGGLVDEKALADALRKGRIGGAGFDVLTEEPPANGNVLLSPDIPNLIVTPHCAWASKEARQRMVQLTAQNLEGIRSGSQSRWVV
ncbi:D-2-hydroxyacid dehydrogenase [Marinobacter halodurans]|uniref:D-2-hydroxyacid dehydrogenase n=1 Tax=Marinobacter halodurans TaxID=2528979 RepID=A0ABY1ZER1_9GAMM|nr:D-2-hydroxyacid dehydrogenase [Marinobacter halodurans]TBW48858.1 D-2-hydroxyacid dehydrogenase [Marinobacter halodurans]